MASWVRSLRSWLLIGTLRRRKRAVVLVGVRFFVVCFCEQLDAVFGEAFLTKLGCVVELEDA